MEYRVEIPQGVTVDVKDGLFSVKGPKGEVKRKFVFPRVQIKKDGNAVLFHTSKPTKREKATIFTTEAHLKNMFKGVLNNAIYKLKICSGRACWQTAPPLPAPWPAWLPRTGHRDCSD